MCCFNVLLFHRFKELGDNPILTHASSYNYELNEAQISIITKARETTIISIELYEYICG